jgi:hypothetical protein
MAQRKSARSERRARQRVADKLARQRQKLAALEAGGAPERPLEIGSASLVEPRAASAPCLVCNGAMSAVEHRAETVEGRRLRIARVRCGSCGSERVYYFRLRGAEPS